ncbi:isochorismatase family protein [Kitasatospora sp. NPDC059648]|uniref:isochorismatase family protein n=1 Tax=Kitasatospora sp. NPDC059648 TaxID=3346894 RepID=UPI0036CE76F3
MSGVPPIRLPSVRFSPANAVVLLADYQVGLLAAAHRLPAARGVPPGMVMGNVLALTRSARAEGVPLVVTTRAALSGAGRISPALAAALPPGLEVLDRATANAWDTPQVRAAVAATERSELVVAGLRTETSLTLTALAAASDGYQVYGTVDTGCAFGPAAENVDGLVRVARAGVVLVGSSAIAEAFAAPSSALTCHPAHRLVASESPQCSEPVR